MEWIVYVLVFVAVTFISYIIFIMASKKKEIVSSRLKEIDAFNLFNEDMEDELKLSFVDRIIWPAYYKIIRTLGSAAPNNIRDKYEVLIEISGSSKNITFNKILSLQIVLAILFLCTSALLFELIGKPSVWIPLATAVVGFYFPYVALRSKARKRQEKILNSLPDMLDLLFVSVEAGLGFDMALQRTTDKMEGPLSEEMKKTLDEINKGKRREDAFRAIVKRTGVRDLSTFITSVIQTEQLGSNIANMLRIQSTTVRQKRRQRAEEKAMKVPVKILFPMIIFIFPPLFVVILGPTVINVIMNFM